MASLERTNGYSARRLRGWRCTAARLVFSVLLVLTANPVFAQATANEVSLESEFFGVGDIVRPGDWAGIRIKLQDSAPRQREVLIEIASKDADGDRPLYQRVITANPGVWQGVWLYVRLPGWFAGGSGRLQVSAYEAVDAEEGFEAGRLIGRTEAGAKSAIASTTGLIYVIGQRSYGLGRYAMRHQKEDTIAPFGHELTDIQSLRPGDLPDRWLGLAAAETIVWGAGEQRDAQGDRALAMREWVKRGGHLVVILPPIGETWTDSASGDLGELLPRVSIARREGVDLTPFRPMLTDRRDVVMPRQAVLHVFTPLPEAPPGDAIRLLNGPDGECIVARRLFGAGMVTLIGMDLNQRAIGDAELPDAAVFWNRVLGRRGTWPSGAEITARQQQGSFDRAPGDADSMISGEIAKTGRAYAGLLLGFFVFAAYWVVAGPLVQIVLRQRQSLRHSWLAFVLAAAAFTGIAWSGASWLRPKLADAAHLTIFDAVHGQLDTRARAWMSVLIPSYGDATISVAPSSGAAATGPVDVITPWEPPDNGGGGPRSFPDARSYIVDGRGSPRLTVPSRSTVKQVRVDWTGPSSWSLPTPAEDGVRLDPDAQPGQGLVRGRLTHGLPAPLEDVVVFVVRRQLEPAVPSSTGPDTRLIANGLSSDVLAFKFRDAWAPGVVLDLGAVTDAGSSDLTAREYLRQIASNIAPTFGLGGRRSDNSRAMRATSVDPFVALSVIHQLEPPDDRSQDLAARPAVLRRDTHGLDLSRWFTAPCVMIIGLVAAESPVPMQVDGRPIPTRGRTCVRWVYPLPDDPPPFMRPVPPTPPIEPASVPAPEQ